MKKFVSQIVYQKCELAYTFDNFLPVYPRRFHIQECFQDVREVVLSKREIILENLAKFSL